MIRLKQHGDFSKTEKFLTGASRKNYRSILARYGERGVTALKAATPTDTGATADAWSYQLDITRSGYTLQWTNSNVNNGVPIALVLQYGHATRNGGYVQGLDYINPALKPIFDDIAQEIWREVTGP